MKKMLLLGFTVLLSGAVMGAPGNGSGTIVGGSAIDLDILANVVDKIAVNQAAPIDFGNILRGKTGTINEVTKGRITVETSAAAVATKLEFDKISGIVLAWNNDNGSVNIPASTRTVIDGVQLNNGLIIPNASGGGGEINETATASTITAYDIGAQFTAATSGNLGTTQKLGKYSSKVRVTATL